MCPALYSAARMGNEKATRILPFGLSDSLMEVCRVRHFCGILPVCLTSFNCVALDMSLRQIAWAEVLPAKSPRQDFGSARCSFGCDRSQEEGSSNHMQTCPCAAATGRRPNRVTGARRLCGGAISAWVPRKKPRRDAALGAFHRPLWRRTPANGRDRRSEPCARSLECVRLASS